MDGAGGAPYVQIYPGGLICVNIITGPTQRFRPVNLLLHRPRRARPRTRPPNPVAEIPHNSEELKFRTVAINLFESFDEASFAPELRRSKSEMVGWIDESEKISIRDLTEFVTLVSTLFTRATIEMDDINIRESLGLNLALLATFMRNFKEPNVQRAMRPLLTEINGVIHSNSESHKRIRDSDAVLILKHAFINLCPPKNPYTDGFRSLATQFANQSNSAESFNILIKSQDVFMILKNCVSNFENDFFFEQEYRILLMCNTNDEILYGNVWNGLSTAFLILTRNAILTTGSYNTVTFPEVIQIIQDMNTSLSTMLQLRGLASPVFRSARSDIKRASKLYAKYHVPRYVATFAVEYIMNKCTTQALVDIHQTQEFKINEALFQRIDVRVPREDVVAAESARSLFDIFTTFKTGCSFSHRGPYTVNVIELGTFLQIQLENIRNDIPSINDLLDRMHRGHIQTQETHACHIFSQIVTMMQSVNTIKNAPREWSDSIFYRTVLQFFLNIVNKTIEMIDVEVLLFSATRTEIIRIMNVRRDYIVSKHWVYLGLVELSNRVIPDFRHIL